MTIELNIKAGFQDLGKSGGASIEPTSGKIGAVVYGSFRVPVNKDPSMFYVRLPDGSFIKAKHDNRFSVNSQNVEVEIYKDPNDPNNDYHIRGLERNQAAAYIQNDPSSTTPAIIQSYIDLVNHASTGEVDDPPNGYSRLLIANQSIFRRKEDGFQEQVSFLIFSPPYYGVQESVTIASDVATLFGSRNVTMLPEAGSADDVIELIGMAAGQYVFIIPDVGATLTFKHNDAGATDKFMFHDELDKTITYPQTIAFFKPQDGIIVDVYTPTSVDPGPAPGTQYRQYLFEVIGGVPTFLMDEDGNPITALFDLE